MNRSTKDAIAKRDAVLAQLGEYWALLPRLSTAKPETIAFAQTYLADDFIVRFGDVPFEVAGAEMLAGIASGNDDVWVTHVDPRYVIVDVEAGRAAVHFGEKLTDPVGGEILREASYFTHIEFSLDEGQLKLQYEHMIEVPAKFRSDVRPGPESEGSA
jgi:hypothetical protein